MVTGFLGALSREAVPATGALAAVWRGGRHAAARRAGRAAGRLDVPPIRL